MHLSLHLFLFSLPLHPCNLFLLLLPHTAIYSKALSFCYSHSLIPVISVSPLFLLLHTFSIPCPSFATSSSASHIHFHAVRLLASSSNLLFAQKMGCRCPIPGDTLAKAGQALDNLTEQKLYLFIAGKLEYIIFKVPFLSNDSMILWLILRLILCL